MAGDDWKTTVIERLTDSMAMLLTVGGLVFLLLAVVGTVPKFGEVSSQGRGLSVVVGGVLIVLALRQPTGPGRPPNKRKFDVRIVSPKAGDVIGVTAVRGTIAKKVPDNYTLEVMRIYPASRGPERYYQMRSARVEDDGTWQALNCDIGGQKGEPRSIAVWLVGPTGRDVLAYVEEAAKVHNASVEGLRKSGVDVPYLPPLSVKTSDMVECCRIDVTRT